MVQKVPLLLLALIAGYVVTVMALLILTTTLSTTRRGVAMKAGELPRGYAMALAFFWMISSLLGVYVAEALRGKWTGWKVAAELAAILIVLLWTNNMGNVREGRSPAERAVLSVMCAAGAALGYVLVQEI
jgi:uncharacterized membrane protein YfcA